MYQQVFVTKLIVVIGITLLLYCPLAQGHKPIFNDNSGIDPASAVVVKTPHISQVLYREITPARRQVWLAIDNHSLFDLYVQIGIPQIDHNNHFRPAFAVVGPGLERAELDFELTEDWGGKTFTTAHVDPNFFHERFTKTNSWILHSETVTLPKKDRYHVVVYSPCHLTGKFWISVGQKENFTVFDWLKFSGWKKKVRKFHEADRKMMSTMTIDDFSNPLHSQASQTGWTLITDQVMGGVSTAQYEIKHDDCFKFIHLQGDVSLDNNGGFVQVALPLATEGQGLDAQAYSGLRFWAKGNNESYYVHLRNNQTWLPWQYFSARFKAGDEWTQINIPFSDFEPQSLSKEFSRKKLSRIGFVGAKKEFHAELSIGPVEFYGEPD